MVKALDWWADCVLFIVWASVVKNSDMKLSSKGLVLLLILSEIFKTHFAPFMHEKIHFKRHNHHLPHTSIHCLHWHGYYAIHIKRGSTTPQRHVACSVTCELKHNSLTRAATFSSLPSCGGEIGELSVPGWGNIINML